MALWSGRVVGVHGPVVGQGSVHGPVVGQGSRCSWPCGRAG